MASGPALLRGALEEGGGGGTGWEEPVVVGVRGRGEATYGLDAWTGFPEPLVLVAAGPPDEPGRREAEETGTPGLMSGLGVPGVLVCAVESRDVGIAGGGAVGGGGGGGGREGAVAVVTDGAGIVVMVVSVLGVATVVVAGNLTASRPRGPLGVDGANVCGDWGLS